MALTKISTGGVKDDAASQAKIADEAIDEARLQISNAGSNGQFLSKQSGNTGGLTWANVPAQYTHPNHSGEVTSTGDGATVIADNIVDEANLKVSNSPTNGQLLSAQSGNAGGLTWTDPPASAPQIEATADGDITAGDTCIVNSNGTVKKVTPTYTEKTAVLGDFGDPSMGGGYNAENINVGFDENRKQVLFFWKSQQGPNNGTVVIGSITGDSGKNISYKGTSPYYANVVEAGISRAWGIAWSKTSELGVVVYTKSNKVYAEAFTNSGTACTFGSALEICDTSGTQTSAAISWDSTANKFLLVVGLSTEGGSSDTADMYVISHSGTTLSSGSRVELESNSYRWGTLAYDKDNNKHLWTYRDNNDSGKLAARIITISGTTPSAGSEVVSGSSDIDAARCVYITGGKFVVAYTISGEVKARVITVSGTAPSFGTESSKIDDNQAVDFIDHLSATYDTATGKVVVGCIPTQWNAKWRALTIDTSNNTISAIGSQNTIGAARTVHAYYYPAKNMHIFGGRKSDAHGYAQTAITADVTTNATTENYIGIAASTVSNGATATIDVSGATNTSQSALTPGQKYYVQPDGSLDLIESSPKVFAGTAIASTKLIVNDQAPLTDIGMWKLVANADLNTYTGNEYDIFTDFASRTEKWWKLVFRIEAPSGSNDFSGSGIRVKVNDTWQSANYDFQQFICESTSEVGTRQNAHNRFRFTDKDEKWHAGEITFYDPNESGVYKIFDYNGYAANHSWAGTTDSPTITRAVGGFVGSTNPVQGIRFWKNSGNFGKIHYGLFASNGW